MSSKQALGVFVIVLVLLPSVVPACEWDNDTLEMERQRFPSALELLTGTFLKHSDEYYRWRIEDRLRRIADEGPRPEWYDDLAVAYDKTDQQDLALETIAQKEAEFPGRYETYANWGTFLIHSQRFEEGLEKLRQAIAINPDAHFGREIYQILLVEYVLERRGEADAITLPLMGPEEGAFAYGPPRGFAAYVLSRQQPATDEADSQPLDRRQTLDELERALQGVLGMLRFGNHQSPILLEAAGDLMLAGQSHGAKQLATRAYLRAAEEAGTPEVAEAYRAMAEEAIHSQTVPNRPAQQMSLAAVDDQLQQELQRGSAFQSEIRDYETEWIAAGVDVDAKFAERYYEQPSLPSLRTEATTVLLWGAIAIAAVGFLALMLACFLVWRLLVSPRLVTAAGKPGK